MSATTENLHHAEHDHVLKKEHQQSNGSLNHVSQSGERKDSDKHPLHQYDLSMMSRLYESCLAKASEEQLVAKWWKPDEWAAERHDRKHDWTSPIVVGHKQRVYEAFARLAKDNGEPMILLPNFDFGDVINFERFLDALKLDGVNAIGRYKQYLNSRDIRKFEIDLVAIHPVHGIMLVETKESDLFDNKKRSRARMHLNAARQSFEAILRLILEANGMKPSECQVPVYQFVALPNVREMPSKTQQQQQSKGSSNQSSSEQNAANTSSSSIGSASHMSSSAARPNRAVNYLIRSDLEEHGEFVKWWKRAVEEPSRLLAEAKREEEEREKEKRDEKKDDKRDDREKKLNKKELINQMLGLVACIRNNSIMPVVYPEMESSMENGYSAHMEERERENNKEENKEDNKQHLNQPALNVYAEFLRPAHERARALSKCVVLSRDSEKIRRTICLQAMWLLLNDSQKKISVVTSESNKPYYEEFFARQRKVYNNLTNLRFYVDIHSCDPSQHTLKRDGEIWFFDSGVTMKTDSGVTVASLNDILTRVKDLPSYWIFTENFDQVGQHNHEFSSLGVKHVELDEQHHHRADMSSSRIKLPMRLHCDLLIVGDLIGPIQLKYLYKHLKSNSVLNQAHAYQSGRDNGQQQQQQYQPLKFNPVKKFRTVKFIRGGTIENLRNALKMHDSIQAPVVFMHIGDEDLFKNRQSMTTIERIKELGTLVREYCPKSFVVLSTLMRRQSRTENGVISEVNKGITSFCKQTKESLNCYYMLNNHFEPDYHTQSGRVLTGKGLKLFADNLLFTVDYFLIRNNKQH